MQKGFRQSLEALYRRSQRESNAHASYGYAQLLMSLIQEWRALFKRPELPFIFAQLPNCTLEPDCDWPRLRDKQRRALTLRNTAMVVTIGYGEDNDLHPLDKRHVAQRLTTAAESLVYGRDCEPMGRFLSWRFTRMTALRSPSSIREGDWSARATCLLTSWSREARYIG
ncbi:sialate O-acetylesterase [Bifidobacterium pseudocatenulatum]|nr:sialate O-acetylesterase [Bifidobacterium pseudocatenulatum]